MKRIGAMALVLTASTILAEDVWKPTGALWLKLSKQGDVIDATPGPAWLVAPPIEGIAARLGAPTMSRETDSPIEIGPVPRVVETERDDTNTPVVVPSRPRVIDISLEKPPRSSPIDPKGAPTEVIPPLPPSFGPVPQKIDPTYKPFQKISPYNPIIHPQPRKLNPRIG